MIPGRASGVCLAALWNRMMLPSRTLDVIRLVISGAVRSFQSRESRSHIGERRWYRGD